MKPGASLPHLAWYRDRRAWKLLAIRFAPWFAGLSLAWEIAQLPLYTLWTEATPAYMAYAVVHCTLGDVLIGAAALLRGLILVRAESFDTWPWRRIAVSAALLGAAYTVTRRHAADRSSRSRRFS